MNLVDQPPRSANGPRRRAVAAVSIALFLGLSAYFGAFDDAEAGYVQRQGFCPNAYLAPHGKAGDICSSANYHWNYQIDGTSAEHSICASASTNGTKSGLTDNWACTAGPYSSVENPVPYNRWTDGIIVNNTAGDSNHGSGTMDYCETQGCVNG